MTFRQRREDFTKSAGSVFSLLSGVRREVENMIRERFRKSIDECQIVQQDEFEALRELVIAQGERIQALEAASAGKPATARATGAKAAPTKAGTAKAGTAKAGTAKAGTARATRAKAATGGGTRRARRTTAATPAEPPSSESSGSSGD